MNLESNDAMYLKDNPPIIKTGTLYIKKKPIYIIEKVENGEETEYVTVYNVFKEQIDGKSPIKDYRVERRYSEFKGDTPLTKFAKRYYQPKGHNYRVEEPPVFMEPIVWGKNTFTGREGKGFYEREQDRFKKEGDKVVLKKGDRTGIFITLDSITWEKLVVAPKDIYETYEAQKLLWFGV